MWTSRIAASLLVVAACADVPTPDVLPSPAERNEPGRALRAATLPDAKPVPLPKVPWAQIGWPRAPRISKAARAANTRALKAHRRGDFVAARTGFAEAVATSPDYDLARFNLACAMAQSGDLDGARTELSTVLRRDLWSYVERWRGEGADPDLEPLRDGHHAATLDVLVEDLEDTYDKAHDVGIAAYLYDYTDRYAEPSDDGWDTPRGGMRALVAGVWVHDAGRFVPLVHGGSVALLDLPNRRAIRAHTAVDHLHCATINREPLVELLSTRTPRDSAQIDVDHEALGVPAEAFDLGTEFLGEIGFGWTDDAALINVTYGWEERPASLVLPLRGNSRRVPRRQFIGPWLEVVPEGSRLRPPEAPGYTLRRRTLQIAGRPTPISLDATYDDVFVAGGYAFLLARRFEEDSSGPTRNDATVARVNLATGIVHRIAKGRGAAWIVVDADDAVYIEIGGETRRWSSPDADTSATTMPGLHVTMPLQDPFCDCCG